MKLRQSQPVIICGPSGSGKSTLLKRLLAEYQDLFTFTVSHTTRSPRKGESDGREYHFVDEQTMLAMIGNGEFVEHTNFSGNYYGTSKMAVRNALLKNKHLILEVDIDGVKALNEIKDLKPVFIFIKPPSKQLLYERLASRGSETKANLQLRMDRADKELEFADSGQVHFDIILVNDDLDDTYRRLKHFLAHKLGSFNCSLKSQPQQQQLLQGPKQKQQQQQPQHKQVRVLL